MVTDIGSLSIRLVLIAFLIGLWAMMSPERSYACSCVMPGSPSEELAEASAVFMGRAVSVSTDEASEDLFKTFQTEFLVTTVWKGPLSSTIYINTDSGSCGFENGFAAGREYIVYAYGSRSNLSTASCSRTTPLAWGMDDLAGLGEGTAPPQPTHTPTPRPASTAATGTATTHTPEQSGPGGGCGTSPQTFDLSFAGLMVGLVSFGLLKSRSRRRRDD